MEEKIRVLHILDELNTGGAEKIVISYLENMDINLFQCDFIITEPPGNEKGLLEEQARLLGGRVIKVPRKRKNYAGHLLSVRKIVKSGDYKIIHSHLDELSALYLFFGWMYGVKVRIGHGHLAGADRGRGVELLCGLLRPLLKLTATDWFACGKDAGIALWGKKASVHNKIHIMHNAIDTRRYGFCEETRNRVRNTLNIQNLTILGSVGRLSYQKNSEFLIEIMKEYCKLDENSRLLIIGVGDLEQSLRELAEKYDISSKVIFLGGRGDVNELMMAMDVFILPSRFEGLPIVLVEAQCTGLSCVVSDKVTNEIEINSNVQYFPLQCSAMQWAELIYQKIISTKFDRRKGQQVIAGAGYEISREAKKLESFYINAVGRKTNDYQESL